MLQSDLIAQRYARALLELGELHHKVERFAEQLGHFEALYTGCPELPAVLANPGLSLAERQAVLAAILAKQSYEPLFCNFLKLLVDRSRLRLLPRIRAAYGAGIDTRLNRVRGVATSAAPIRPSPGRKHSASAGTPAWCNSWMACAATSGVCSAGLATTVLPAASAAAIWPTKMASGKFHGLMQTNTPRPCSDNVLRSPVGPGSWIASANFSRACAA